MLSTPADLLLRGSGLLLLLCIAAACAQAQPTPGDRPAAPSSVRTSYREMPARLCVPVKPEAWAALQSGSTRLVLHLQNQQPSHVYSRTFHIALLDPRPPEMSKPVLLDEISMQPDILTAAGQPGPQHFGIDLKGHLPAAASATLCFEVSVDAENAAEGKGEHPLRIWATLEPPAGGPPAGKPGG